MSPCLSEIQYRPDAAAAALAAWLLVVIEKVKGCSTEMKRVRRREKSEKKGKKKSLDR